MENKKYKTHYRAEFITITNEVEEIIKKSGIKRGTIVIQTHHTTCSLWVNENEKNLIGPSEEIGYTSDLRKVLDNFANPLSEYSHNDIRHLQNKTGKRNTHLCEPDENGIIKECVNGHSHAQAMMLQSSISLIVENGKLLRGKWQEVMLVELDHDREREISFLVSGIL
ncbi:MAG: YjbQ family protein [Candidatus Paceibacterota bacterium]